MSGMKERMKWAKDMYRFHAPIYYWRFWDDIEEIDDPEAGGESNDKMKRLDFSGIDKIVYTPTNQIHIAQRFRTMRNTDEGLEEPDFSIRVETYNDNPTEYQKLKTAWTGVGNTPSVYAFGITPYGRQVALDEGFNKFFLIDCAEFLRRHFDTNDIEILEEAPNGDGSMGAYFSLQDLHDYGCILKQWPERQPKRPEDPNDIREWADD